MSLSQCTVHLINKKSLKLITKKKKIPAAFSLYATNEQMRVSFFSINSFLLMFRFRAIFSDAQKKVDRANCLLNLLLLYH